MGKEKKVIATALIGIAAAVGNTIIKGGSTILSNVADVTGSVIRIRNDREKNTKDKSESNSWSSRSKEKGNRINKFGVVFL
jgi:hypothetical protein